MVVRTPSQTIGPFFHVGLKWDDGNQVAFGAPGEKIVLTGLVYDGAGTPVSDALLETWQPNRPARSQGQARARSHTGMVVPARIQMVATRSKP